MSLKLKAFLADSHNTRLQQALKHNSNILVLKDVPCEMKFISNDGWIEHESEKHQFLPVFHIKGNILSIHGNFPYNVSTLVFDEDVAKRLDKDILYFMTPSEISHLMETGKYFTKHFQVPKVLTNNAYDFPVRVNLTIIKPDDESIYNSANFVLDKDNLPVFYVEFAGSGVNRKRDKLLDYYGIDFDADYDVYAMTAESSGYTEPPLINYITEPEIEREEITKENISDYYLSPEEENSLIRSKEAEKENSEQHIEFTDDYQFTDEDIIIASADKNIEKRIAERVSKMQTASYEKPAESSVKSDENISRSLTDLLASVTNQNTKPNESEKKVQPDTKEQFVEIRMETNEFEDNNIKQDEKKSENTAGVESNENDIDALSDAQGADVSDARLQTKLDEAKAHEAAKSVALDIQSDIVKESEHKERVNRSVPTRLQDIADEAKRQEELQNDDVSYE